MLSYINIALSNPARPDISEMKVRAVVSNDEFGLAMGPQIIEKLQLEQSALHEIMEMGEKKTHLMPYFHPISVSFGGREVTTGGVNCASGVVIGRTLAEALQIDKAAQGAAVKSDKASFTAPPIFPHHKKASEEEISRILIKEDALDKKTIDTLRDFAESEKKLQKKSKKENVPGGRDALLISLGHLDGMVKKIFFRLLTEHVEPFFGQEVEWWETPQMLIYEKGEGYPAHADGYNSGPDNGDGTKSWIRRYNRDISLLIYLNDNFTGGALNFPRQKLKVQPKPGLLVAFPSSPEYLHGAELTEKGERLVLVSWVAAEGSQRVPLKKQPSKILMKPLRKAVKKKDKV